MIGLYNERRKIFKSPSNDEELFVRVMNSNGFGGTYQQLKDVLRSKNTKQVSDYVKTYAQNVLSEMEYIKEEINKNFDANAREVIIYDIIKKSFGYKNQIPEDDKCFCAAEFEYGQQIVKLNCGHYHHQVCLIGWVNTNQISTQHLNSLKCPFCMNTINFEKGESSGNNNH
uniref:FANCL C-terminal domain-containing protein n=1 Tax=Meloidogyne javanica TaxID=6303 RepID=A0A915M6N2_MELJA